MAKKKKKNKSKRKNTTLSVSRGIGHSRKSTQKVALAKRDKKAAKSIAKEMLALQKKEEKAKKPKYPIFTSRLRKWISIIIILTVGVVIVFSFFGKAGAFGETVFNLLNTTMGKTLFFVPVLLLLTAFVILKPQKERVITPAVIAVVLFVIGISGILETQSIGQGSGGFLGWAVSWPLFKYLSPALAFIIFAVIVLVGGLIVWELLPKKKKQAKEEKKDNQKQEELKLIKGESAEEQKSEKPKFEIKAVDIIKGKKQKPIKVKEIKQEQATNKEIKPIDDDYKRPPLDLFDISIEKPSSGDTEKNAEIIQKTLLNFGINVAMDEVNVGPTVAQYTFKPAEGVKLSKIVNLNNDLALSLAAHPIRIEAPIPGKSLVGVEVPNSIRANVKIGSLLANPEFQNSSQYLSLALGMDVMGKIMMPDLGRMPHLLVAGATGSGKTICLNSLILSLICKHSPKQLRLILIDPKRVEFPVYASLPHLLTPVILNARKAVNALNWLVGEMERRFDVLREAGSRDIHAYNSNIEKKQKKGDGEVELMPYIVLVIDELADLMMSKGKEVETSIVRLSQLARAVGIHLIVATQRPSVEVITGLIKANITSRVAFQVASQIDSRTILDTGGAEKLLGRGDMLFISAEFSRPKRIQGSFVATSEMKKAVNYIAKENATEEREELEEAKKADTVASVALTGMSTSEDIVNFSAKDELYDEAKEVVIQYQKASASLLQRRLQIGYARAARILDILEEDGIIGEQDGSRPREVMFAQGQPEEPVADVGPVGTIGKQEDEGPDEEGFIDASNVEIESK